MEDWVSISLVGCRYENLFKTILPKSLVLHSDIFLVVAFCFEQDKTHLLEDMFMYSVDMSRIPYWMHTFKKCTMNSSASSPLPSHIGILLQRTCAGAISASRRSRRFGKRHRRDTSVRCHLYLSPMLARLSSTSTIAQPSGV